MVTNSEKIQKFIAAIFPFRGVKKFHAVFNSNPELPAEMFEFFRVISDSVLHGSQIFSPLESFHWFLLLTLSDVNDPHPDTLSLLSQK